MMIVCYFGTYRKEYSRNRIMIAALRSAGVEVKECHEKLWQGVEDRVNITVGGWKKPAFWWRVVRAYWKLIWKYLKVGDYDVMMVGYPGQFDVFLARLLTNLKGRPLVWDVLMSIYQVATERKLDLIDPKTVRKLKKIEKRACQLPDTLLIESKHYAQWFEENQSVSIEKFAYVPLGADERQFYPRPCTRSDRDSNQINVLYYGSFLPSHGVDLVVEAARKLENHTEYNFVLVGEGPEANTLKQQAEQLNNVTFTGHLSDEALQEQIACADICMGVFGTTPQALMTIQNKIFECMAMQKAVLTGDSKPVQEVLTHKQNSYICRRDTDSIANSILELAQDKELRNHIAQGGYQLFQNSFSLRIIGKTLLTILDNLLFEFGL